MGTWLYHYIYQDVYIPVWPNIVASIIVGAWVIWRNRTHIDRLERRIVHRLSLHTTLISKTVEDIHAHVSHLHSAGSDSSASGNNDSALFAQSEIEQSRDHIG